MRDFSKNGFLGMQGIQVRERVWARTGVPNSACKEQSIANAILLTLLILVYGKGWESQRTTSITGFLNNREEEKNMFQILFPFSFRRELIFVVWILYLVFPSFPALRMNTCRTTHYVILSRNSAINAVLNIEVDKRKLDKISGIGKKKKNTFFFKLSLYYPVYHTVV